MARTTIDIDAPILRDLKRLQKREPGRSLGRLVSDLLAVAITERETRGKRANRRLEWVARPMKARVDLADKDAVLAALDRDE
jgi:hypothetical protein